MNDYTFNSTLVHYGERSKCYMKLRFDLFLDDLI